MLCQKEKKKKRILDEGRTGAPKEGGLK